MPRDGRSRGTRRSTARAARAMGEASTLAQPPTVVLAPVEPGDGDIYSSETERDRDFGDGKFAITVARALEVLSAFGASGPLRNQELVERTGLPKPTISRLTHTLSKLGYLKHDVRAGQFEVGTRLLSLAYSAIASVNIRRIAKPVMDELAAQTNLSIGLGVRDGLTMLYVESSHGQSMLGLQLFEGSRISIATSATGRAYLAAIGKAERDRLLNQLYPQHSHEWRLVLDTLRRDVDSVLHHSFSASLGEWMKHIHGAATPIHLPDRRGIYCLNVGGPSYDLTAERLHKVVAPLLVRAARKIASQLGGWIGPPSGHQRA
jgi:DNA-binding IclR family transcriptional regulator